MNTNTYQDEALNPYATPKSTVFIPSSEDIQYDGKLLSVTHPAVLPKFCIKCGKPCHEEQKKKKLTWTNPWWFLTFFLVGIFVFLISLLVAKRVEVSFSLCPEHKVKERNKNIIMFVGFILSVLLVYLGNLLNNQNIEQTMMGSSLFLIGILMFLVLIIAALFLPKLIFIKKAKYNKLLKPKRPYLFFLGGISKEFIDAAKIKHM